MPAVLQLAFRPLFLLGTLYSVVAVMLWAGVWSGGWRFSPYGGAHWWHQHEMLFGFALAIAVGFTLTAVQTWTGQRSVHGWPLLGLISLWLAARLVLIYPMGLNGWVLLSVDLAFPVCAAIALARRVIAVRQWRNLGFVPILLALAGCNGLMHAGVMLQRPELSSLGSHLALLLFVCLIVLVGGRVIPMFTANRLQTPQPQRYPLLEWSALLSPLALVIAELVVRTQGLAGPWLVTTLAAIAAISNGWRLLSWRGWQASHEPMLWSLHLAYAFVPLGLASWTAANLTDAVQMTTAVHLLGIGAVGGMILSFITRVSLGHTGRAISTPPGMPWMFGLMFAAALLRAMAPPDPAWVLLTATAWTLACAAFLLHCLPILIRPRPDGQPG